QLLDLFDRPAVQLGLGLLDAPDRLAGVVLAPSFPIPCEPFLPGPDVLQVVAVGLYEADRVALVRQVNFVRHNRLPVRRGCGPAVAVAIARELPRGRGEVAAVVQEGIDREPGITGAGLAVARPLKWVRIRAEHGKQGMPGLVGADTDGPAPTGSVFSRTPDIP